jgi:hypothetical protein
VWIFFHVYFDFVNEIEGNLLSKNRETPQMRSQNLLYFCGIFVLCHVHAWLCAYADMQIPDVYS